MLSVDVIKACYRVLLGREAENDGVIQGKADLPDYQALLANFVESGEYRNRFPGQFRTFYLATGRRVDVAVSAEDLARMFDRIRDEWSKLGEEDPYWSVLTLDDYRSGVIDEALKETFFATGAESARAIEVFAERAGVAAPKGRCVEFGCGVGRVTVHLAKLFEEVVAVDISPKNLEICAQAVRDLGLDNVTTQLLGAPDDVERIPACDFVFSTIVLQHNPPPVQHFLLDALLSKLNPGGGFLFQIPTHSPGYHFDAAAYLASAPGGMEMHDLPMADVFRLLAKHDAAPLEVLMDEWTGLYGSHTFFGLKGA